jgi:hypothetical protein
MFFETANAYHSKSQKSSEIEGATGFFRQGRVRFLTGFTDCANQNEIIENDCTRIPRSLLRGKRA